MSHSKFRKMLFEWEKGLKFGTFESLLEVADCGSIDAAAKHQSVATIQRHLDLLDKFFCCKVRNKTGKTVRLSAKGEQLAKLFRQQRLDFLNFKDSCENKLSSVRIAAGDSLLHLIVIPKLAVIQKQFPSCTIHITDLGTVDILQRLRNFSLDFGIVREESLVDLHKSDQSDKIEHEDEDESLDYKTLGRYKYSIFIPKVFLPDSKTEESDLPNLQIPVAMIQNHWGKNFVKMAESKGNFPMNIRVWCETFSQVARLVRLKGYAGILPQFFRGVLPKPEFFELEPSYLKGEVQNIVMAWNKNLLKVRQKSLAPFIDFVGAQLKFTELSALV